VLDSDLLARAFVGDPVLCGRDDRREDASDPFESSS
jgi:hypothetical protein